MLRIFVRGPKWYCEGYYWDERTNARKSFRRSTGIIDDGTTRTKRVAEQVAHKIAQSYATGAVRRARSLTIEGAIKVLVAKLERGDRAQATIDVVIEKASHLYRLLGPDSDAAALSDVSLAEYADARLKEWAHPPRSRVNKRTKKEVLKYPGKLVSRGTVHRELRTIREALIAAKEAGKFDGAIPRMPDIGEVYTPKERVLDEPESHRLWLATGVRWRDYIAMWRTHGIDEGELYDLERADLYWSRREFRVRGTKTEARDRVLPMTAATYEILRRRAAEPGPLFPPWGNADRDIKRACRKAGLAACCIKDLRRSFATELAIAGVPILHLKELMGHTSTRMLEEVYAKVKRGQHMHDAMAHATTPGGAKKWTDSVRDSTGTADAADTPDSD